MRDKYKAKYLAVYEKLRDLKKRNRGLLEFHVVHALHYIHHVGQRSKVDIVCWQFGNENIMYSFTISADGIRLDDLYVGSEFVIKGNPVGVCDHSCCWNRLLNRNTSSPGRHYSTIQYIKDWDIMGIPEVQYSVRLNNVRVSAQNGIPFKKTRKNTKGSIDVEINEMVQRGVIFGDLTNLRL